jgi:hypothetical protein
LRLDHKNYKNQQIDSKLILQFRADIPIYGNMIHPRSHKRISKVFALLAATLILPVLAYAQQNNQGGNNQGGNNQGGHPVVPETNAGWVLVPFFGAVLLFSARRLFRAKAQSRG